MLREMTRYLANSFNKPGGGSLRNEFTESFVFLFVGLADPQLGRKNTQLVKGGLHG